MAQRRLVQFLALATLVHMAALPLLGWLVPDAPDVPAQKRLRMVSLASPSAMRPMARPQPKRPTERDKQNKEPEKEKDKDKPEDLVGQIVELPPSPDNTAPEEYDYLSEHNTRTERQTKSRHSSNNPVNVMNERTVAQRSEMSTPQPSRETTAIEIGPEDLKDKEQREIAGEQAAFEVPKLKQRDELALQTDAHRGSLHNQKRTEALQGNSKRLKLAMGESEQTPSEASSAPRRAPTMAQLVPEIGVLARLTGSPFADHIEDIEEGEGTFLNSREFRFATYFNRLKRDVSQQWSPLAEYRRRDPSGNIYGHRARHTVVSVTLHPDGRLKDVAVAKPSGVDFLDREALSAFKRAQPFPNPPSGLIDDDSGLIEFPFGFYIEFSRSGGIRLPF